LKVVDAGVIVELVVGGLDPDRLGVEDLAAPHLLDSEVTHILRGLALRGAVTHEHAAIAMDGFAELAIVRYPADWLRPRMWALRHNLSAYDATYVALTELTAATSLLTTDARLASAAGVRCAVELL
jgi:predicted nucleic acid-binding protein